MAKVQSQVLLGHIFSLFEAKTQAAATDAELLEAYVAHREQAAFTALVRRHGPMVLSVGRRHIGQAADVEDVFQATFLLLAQNARRIRNRESVGAWLHGVAFRLALKARKQRALRESRERRAACMKSVPSPSGARWEVQELLDQALQQLPEQYRRALVACYLEGKTQEEAARQLGCPLGTVRSWVARGRALLHRRLTRRGLTLSAGAFVALLAASTASARVAPALVHTTLTAASRLTACKAVASCGISTKVAGLLQGEMAMTGLKLKLVLALVLTLAAVTAAYPLLGSKAQPKKDKSSPEAKSGETNQPRPAVRPLAGTDGNGDPLPVGALRRLGEVRFRPGVRVTHLAFSPDGKTLASWGNFLYHHDRLSFWDTRTGKELRTLRIQENTLAAFAWCADGRGFAVLTPIRFQPLMDFLVWEFTDPRAKNPFPAKPVGAMGGAVVVGQEPPEHYGPFAIAPDGKWLAAYHAGGKRKPEAVLFRLAPALKAGQLKIVRTIPNLPEDVRTLAFSQDSRSLFFFSHKNPTDRTETLTAFETAGGQKQKTFTLPMALHQGTRKTFAISPSGALLALGLEDGTARLIDLKTGRQTRSLGRHLVKGRGAPWNGVSTVGFTPDGTRLITGGRDNVLKVWDVATGRELFHMAGHHSWPEAMAVSTDGKRLASSGQDSLIRLWDPATGKPVVAPRGHSHTVWDLAVSRDGRLALTDGWDGKACLWDLRTGREVRSFSQNSNTKAVLAGDGTVLTQAKDRWQLWDRTGKERALPGDLAGARGGLLGFSPDGRTLLTAENSTVTLWAWPGGKRLQQIQGEKKVQKALLTKDGRTVVTVEEEGTVDIWERKTGKKQGTLPLRAGRYPDLVRLTDEGLLVAVGFPAANAFRADRIMFCDVKTQKIVRDFPMKKTAARILYALGLAVSADGQTVAVGQSDGNAVLYEVATGQARRVLRGHREAIANLAFTPDGKLVTVSLDHTGLVWDVTLRAGKTPSAKPLDAKEQQTLWETLGNAKTEPAFEALEKLAVHQKSAVALLRRHLRPARGVDDATLDRLLKDLDSKQFKVRRKASRELESYGETALAGVKRRLAQVQSLELRHRLEAFLKTADPDRPTAERLQEIRALQLLEELATPDALALLRDLARGTANARRTDEAAKAVERILRARN
jgi:RNA polymerase sigma factor (sigma-70 family)